MSYWMYFILSAASKKDRRKKLVIRKLKKNEQMILKGEQMTNYKTNYEMIY